MLKHLRAAEGEPVSEGDDDDSPKWRDELARRRASVRDGSCQLIAAADVVAELRARFA